MIKRDITDNVLRALKHQAAVALIGPRQVGKTTLALEIAESRESVLTKAAARGCVLAVS